MKEEGEISELEMLLAEKDENLKSVTTELERTQKLMSLLNNSSSKLDHLIITGKSFGDYGGVGYKGESSGSKIVFVKSDLLDDSINIYVKKPNVSYFHVFGIVCIFNDKERLGKFDAKSDDSVFLGYSNNSKVCHVYNMRMQTIMESFNVVIYDSCDFSKFSKEENISSLIEETDVESSTDQPVATPNKTGSSPSKSVATAATPEIGTMKLSATKTR